MMWDYRGWNVVIKKQSSNEDSVYRSGMAVLVFMLACNISKSFVMFLHTII